MMKRDVLLSTQILLPCGIGQNSTIRLLTLQNHYIFDLGQIQQKSWLIKPTFLFLAKRKSSGSDSVLKNNVTFFSTKKEGFPPSLTKLNY